MPSVLRCADGRVTPGSDRLICVRESQEAGGRAGRQGGVSEAAGTRRLEVGWSVLVVVAAFGLSLLPLLAGFVHSETFTAEDLATAQS